MRHIGFKTNKILYTMKFKRTTAIIMLIALQLFSTILFAQEKNFTAIKESWASPFKAQGNNGCPIFSMVSFFESEIYRTSNQKMELSQMYLLYHVFIEKTERYLRLRSYDTYSTGGLFDDAIYLMGKYGIVPLEDYIGPRNEKGYYEHGPLYGEFEYRFLPQLFEKAKKHELNIDWNNGTATRPWLTDLTEMLDRHLGKLPTQVNYEGQTYTPLEFSKKIVKLPLNDYVKLTSYSNMPFYQPDILYLKDNWLNKNNFYSLPIDQFIETIDHAIKNNYTLALDLDITLEQLKDSANYCEYREDTMVTQDIRDELLDNWYTKDVHLVHLVGIAHDEAGKKYYIIKDSVGKQLGVHTKRYLSENFVRAKILTVILHKDGIPSAIRRKMKINS